MNRVLAEDINLGPIGGEGFGPFGDLGSGPANSGGAVEALRGITGVISAIIGVMTIAAFIWFMFQFIIGGFNWITSAGDKSKLESARNRITHGLIGLVIVVGGWSILALIGQFFGFNVLIDPQTVIEQLGQIQNN